MERHQDYGKQDGWKKLKLRFDWDSSGRLLVYSVVIGFLAGFLALLAYVGFQAIGKPVKDFYTTVGIDLPVPEDYTSRSGPLPGETYAESERKDVFGTVLILPRYWILILLIPSFGGLLCGFLVWSFAPEASGEGTDCVIRAFHFRSGFLRKRVPIVKTLAGFLTIGSGGSAGWEGPTMLLGAGVAGMLSKPFRFGGKDRRILILAGAAGGLGAIFQIPFGGAFFALEILYASTAFELTAIIPCVTASVVGYSTFRFLHGQWFGHDMRTLQLPGEIGLQHPTDFLLYLAFVPIITLCGFLFVRMVLEFRNRIFRRMAIPEFLKPALGGFLLGVVALIYPQVFGGGYEWINRLLEGQLPFLLIITLILPKMLATAFTVSSGGSGGFLTPSIFIGGLIGASLGHLCARTFDVLEIACWAPDITTCTLVGMAVFYAGIGKIPLAAAIIVCEMIGGDYTLLVPLLILNLVSIAIQSPTTSLYEEQVLAPVDSEAHFGTYSIDLLRVIAVRDACFDGEECQRDVLTIPAEATIPKMAGLIASRPDSLFPIVDREHRLIGVLQADDVWSVFRDRKKWDAICAANLSRQMDITVFPDDDLYKALRICMLWQISEIPVVDPRQPDKLLGILHHDEIIAAYNERLAAAQWT